MNLDQAILSTTYSVLAGSTGFQLLNVVACFGAKLSEQVGTESETRRNGRLAG